MQLGDTDVYTARDMTCPGCGEGVALVAVTPLVYTDQFGPNSAEVARFVTSLETMPRELLERAEAALMPDCCESPEWAAAAARAEALDLHDVEFVAAIEAAWAHAARHPQFEHWDHVWDAGASHAAASLVVRGQIHPRTFNTLTAPFIAAGVIPAEPQFGSDVTFRDDAGNTVIGELAAYGNHGERDPGQYVVIYDHAGTRHELRLDRWTQTA